MATMATSALVSRLAGFCVAVPGCSPRAPTQGPIPHGARFRAAGSDNPSSDSTPQGSDSTQNAPSSALERAMAYKRLKASSKSTPTSSSSPPPPVQPPTNPEILVHPGPIQSSRSSTSPTSGVAGEPEGSTVALSAFARAKAYKLQQSEMIAALNSTPVEAQPEAEETVVEIEIHTRDGIVRRKVLKPDTAFANVKDIKRTGVSTLDFVGLGFADKKSTTSPPAGLAESFAAPSGPLPEVEMLTRDANPDAMVEGADVYRPRVTTWGMFPRPADISKAVSLLSSFFSGRSRHEFYVYVLLFFMHLQVVFSVQE